MLPFTFYRTIHLDCPVFIWRYTMKEQKIKVLALLPMELPKEIELDNTLEAMQKFPILIIARPSQPQAADVKRPSRQNVIWQNTSYKRQYI